MMCNGQTSFVIGWILILDSWFLKMIEQFVDSILDQHTYRLEGSLAQRVSIKYLDMSKEYRVNINFQD